MKRVSVTEELAYGKALDRLTGGDRPAPAQKRPEPAPQQEAEEVARIKLSVFLGRGEDVYLEGLSSEAKFTGGRKVSKTKLIEAMVRAFRTTNLDMRGVSTDEDLLNRVIAQLRT